MKLIYALAATFFAAAKAQINAPKAGATLIPGQNFTVQYFQGIDTSPEAGLLEVSLVIGIVACGTSACPPPSSNLGEVLLIGQYKAQGSFSGAFLTEFENFTFTVPNGISGIGLPKFSSVQFSAHFGELRTELLEICQN
ncbi:hypothetical protein CPB84DRAFT_1853662 [Gymnopilus junonius]|uniref:Uncharacterized protein n=1 Tax=Gymnopilus junonius TaxID=109634 RepID=A0A9P5N9Q8_GYMJU|nr:hypothetical protein CPB84DRAFT_1853662 [Gymnopilus junonius]